MNCTDIRVLLSNQPHLTNEEVTAVRDHVATCNACSRARLLEQQTSALLDLLEPSTARMAPARVADIEARLNGSSPWRLPLMANLATVVALAALLFWGVQAVRTDRSGLEIADRSSTTPTSLTAASPPATSTPLLTFTPQPSEEPSATQRVPAGPGTPTATVATPTAIVATPAFNTRPTQVRPTNVVPIAPPPSAVPVPPTSIPDVPATATPWVAPTAEQTPDLASAPPPPPTEAPAATAPPGRTRTPIPTATATPEPTATPEETATPGTNPYPYPTPEAPTDTPEPTAEETLEPTAEVTATPPGPTATPIVDPPTAEPTVAPDA
jgi:hypothetical protein